MIQKKEYFGFFINEGIRKAMVEVGILYLDTSTKFEILPGNMLSERLMNTKEGKYAKGSFLSHSFFI